MAESGEPALPVAQRMARGSKDGEPALIAIENAGGQIIEFDFPGVARAVAVGFCAAGRALLERAKTDGLFPAAPPPAITSPAIAPPAIAPPAITPPTITPPAIASPMIAPTAIVQPAIAPLMEPASLSIPAPAQPSDDDVLTADEVAEFLGVDRNTVYDYAGRGVIPHRRLGKRILFLRGAIVSWLGARRVQNEREVRR